MQAPLGLSNTYFAPDNTRSPIGGFSSSLPGGDTNGASYRALETAAGAAATGAAARAAGRQTGATHERPRSHGLDGKLVESADAAAGRRAQGDQSQVRL